MLSYGNVDGFKVLLGQWEKRIGFWWKKKVYFKWPFGKAV